MKFLPTIALLILIGCSGNGKKENVKMPGVYKMLSQRLKGDKIDTTYRSLEQLKIFTDDYVMYANVNPPDTEGSFGFGTYAVNQDTIVENVAYRSSDTARTETPTTYRLGVAETPKGYRQIIPQFDYQGQKATLSEDYEFVGTPEKKSALDGVWKLEKSFVVKGKDTVSHDFTQYKVYYDGYFIWGQSRFDAGKINHTSIGFGKFDLNGNKLSELVMTTTNSDIRGIDVAVDIEMNGPDNYRQTIVAKDSSRSVEIYDRMKK